MKKLISLLLAACSSLCLIGCGEDSIEPCSAHTWGDWQEQKQVTCTVAGIDKRVCSVCGEEETKVIKPSHDYKTMQEKSPTCLEAGWTSYTYCAREGCNYTSKTENNVLTAYGHNWVGYGCTECKATTDEYYLINFSRKFDGENITSYNSVDLATGNLNNSTVQYYEWQHDHGNQNFRLLHRDGMEGIYWRKGGLTLDFETDTFKFRCTDMHQDLGNKAMEAYMMFKNANGTSYTKKLTIESKTPTSNGWYECTVKLPDNLKAKTVVCLYFHADAFNVDDVRAVKNA